MPGPWQLTCMHTVVGLLAGPSKAMNGINNYSIIAYSKAWLTYLPTVLECPGQSQILSSCPLSHRRGYSPGFRTRALLPS